MSNEPLSYPKLALPAPDFPPRPEDDDSEGDAGRMLAVFDRMNAATGGAAPDVTQAPAAKPDSTDTTAPPVNTAKAADGMAQHTADNTAAEDDRVPTVSAVVSRLGRASQLLPAMGSFAERSSSRPGRPDTTLSMLQKMVGELVASVSTKPAPEPEQKPVPAPPQGAPEPAPLPPQNSVLPGETEQPAPPPLAEITSADEVPAPQPEMAATGELTPEPAVVAESPSQSRSLSETSDFLPSLEAALLAPPPQNPAPLPTPDAAQPEPAAQEAAPPESTGHTSTNHPSAGNDPFMPEVDLMSSFARMESVPILRADIGTAVIFEPKNSEELRTSGELQVSEESKIAEEHPVARLEQSYEPSGLANADTAPLSAAPSSEAPPAEAFSDGAAPADEPLPSVMLAPMEASVKPARVMVETSDAFSVTIMPPSPAPMPARPPEPPAADIDPAEDLLGPAVPFGQLDAPVPARVFIQPMSPPLRATAVAAAAVAAAPDAPKPKPAPTARIAPTDPLGPLKTMSDEEKIALFS
jgi:hypothetical protein